MWFKQVAKNIKDLKRNPFMFLIEKTVQINLWMITTNWLHHKIEGGKNSGSFETCISKNINVFSFPYNFQMN
jgi:hypothetical protein